MGTHVHRPDQGHAAPSRPDDSTTRPAPSRATDPSPAPGRGITTQRGIACFVSSKHHAEVRIADPNAHRVARISHEMISSMPSGSGTFGKGRWRRRNTRVPPPSSDAARHGGTRDPGVFMEDRRHLLRPRSLERQVAASDVRPDVIAFAPSRDAPR